MALQTTDPPVSPNPQVVANAFVEQYYHILHHSPELVYRFYHDSSVLSRQEDNGQMTSVTTMQGINAKILSLDYKNYRAEIKTADAQESYKDGVIVLVTGCLTGKDNVRKKFAQSFFLAPQAKGYFVLNDVFRYVDESEPLDPNAITIEKVDDSGGSHTAVYTESPYAYDTSSLVVATSLENNQTQLENSSQASEKERQKAPKEKVPAISQSDNHASSVAVSSQMSIEEDNVKNSYASIVKKATDSSGPTKVYVPANTVKVASTNIQKQASGLLASNFVASTPLDENQEAPERVNPSEEGASVEGFSIFVRNLPANVIDEQLEQEFKRFGPIKPDGVQVRSNKQQGSCYGFVEFLSSSSMEKAIQASPITIEGRRCFVEIKRTITQVDAGQGRFPSRRGGFRNDGFRGRGGFGGGRNFGGNDFGGRREYFGRGRGADSYQRGRGRAGRDLNRNSADR
ncbi:hypothetical protein RND81_03G088900 [Saponaria officinalis]|uniref:G3BP-like protein n=1 Tax=Saponaria officinalis TaxID=3572 RepID=A0AAW1M654_SAPOF